MRQAIKYLNENKCPVCNHNHMAASVSNNKYYVECMVCVTRWEITKEEWDDNVRICDTISYKRNHNA